jgi:regulatory protein
VAQTLGCYERAARLLAGRPHFRAELAAKLRQRGYPEEEIAAALDRLAEQGYLDEAKTAAGFVAHRRERGGEGKLRLRAELQKRGAAAEAIDEALSGLGEEDDLAAARDAAERWSRGGRAGKGDDPLALARHLARKGFPRHAIVALLQERHPLADFEPE